MLTLMRMTETKGLLVLLLNLFLLQVDGIYLTRGDTTEPVYITFMGTDQRSETPSGNGNTLIFDNSYFTDTQAPHTYINRDTYIPLQAQKRLASGIPDFGYGSRISKALYLTKATFGKPLFGAYGPGKRSDILHGHQHVISLCDDTQCYPRKRSDFGFRSRIHLADILAKSAIADNIYGMTGPGKRSNFIQRSPLCIDRPDLCEMTKAKRGLDFGYGSRVRGGANVAKGSMLSGLFGTYGPGK